MLDVRVTGAKETERNLTAYANRLADWRSLWPEFIDAFTRREEIWFRREGEGWAALSPSYADWKAAVRPGKPILVFDGDLKRSLTTHQAVLAQTDTMLVLGTTVPYAKYHQRGTSKMPARPVLIPVLRFQAAIARLMRRHVSYRPFFGEVPGG